ncbi:DUF4062 domain-containing protein [Leptospira montravelensis]|uniref:DUF4062 domain-containing protein n=1 Tax=Leptospira montravelensis TaxID=2484961 RepID=A0ABY2LW12_9LEPT|nr:DUF4062 domain-containing protein [Leptospira montravelensis]TGK87185.1 DUF4062 domain-containing protein [Leptospira montravelensis]TGL06744.1 DUF4062 domain-containing protein [Leptospira montravelensis]
MNIFISSTIFDLIDLRAEIFHHLIQTGFTVRLSEIDSSDFELFPDKSAIETCLENLRRSDYVIFIIDKRYGNTVENLGYPKLSVTHLEYLEAKKNSKPILFYIRDKTYGEYKVYKSNPNGFKPNWIHEKEFGIFSLISTHGESSDKTDNNWIIPFRNSIDIKASLEKKLKIPYLKMNLARKIAEGEIPILEAQMITNIEGNDVVLKSEFTNTSEYTIFIKSFGYKDELKSKDFELLAPKERKHISQIWSLPQIGQIISSFIIVEYSTYDGITVTSEYQTNARLNAASAIIYGIDLKTRKFKIESPVEISFDN